MYTNKSYYTKLSMDNLLSFLDNTVIDALNGPVPLALIQATRTLYSVDGINWVISYIVTLGSSSTCCTLLESASLYNNL